MIVQLELPRISNVIGVVIGRCNRRKSETNNKNTRNNVIMQYCIICDSVRRRKSYIQADRSDARGARESRGSADDDGGGGDSEWNGRRTVFVVGFPIKSRAHNDNDINRITADRSR